AAGGGTGQGHARGSGGRRAAGGRSRPLPPARPPPPPEPARAPASLRRAARSLRLSDLPLGLALSRVGRTPDVVGGQAQEGMAAPRGRQRHHGAPPPHT